MHGQGAWHLHASAQCMGSDVDPNAVSSKSGQVRSSQVKSSQVRSSQVKSSQVKSSQVRSSQVKSGQVRSGQARSGQVRPGQVRSSQAKSSQVKSRQGKASQVKSRQVKSRQGTLRHLDPERRKQHLHGSGSLPGGKGSSLGAVAQGEREATDDDDGTHDECGAPSA